MQNAAGLKISSYGTNDQSQFLNILIVHLMKKEEVMILTKTIPINKLYLNSTNVTLSHSFPLNSMVQASLIQNQL